MAHVYHVQYLPDANGIRKDLGFPLAMKIPRMTSSDGGENIVSFEVEAQILPALHGNHFQRFVRLGDLAQTPYLVMEYIPGKTLEEWINKEEPLPYEEIAKLGSSVAHAIHNLHKLYVCHLDLKPANIIIRDDGSAALVDFGLSFHAHYPDLLAEEMRNAIGTAAWIAPEQIVGTRGDPRSDLYALGVIIYQLATGVLPFGSPQSISGIRKRLWMDPIPPRLLQPEIPDWLQEIILKCLAPEAANRYSSAAHLAFDFTHFDQILITKERGLKLKATSFKTHFIRWLQSAGREYQPSPFPTYQIEQVPIIMVAIPYKETSEEILNALRETAERSLGTKKGARLTCITIIPPVSIGLNNADSSETELQRRYLSKLKIWAKPIDMTHHLASYHVLESTDVANTLVQYAKANHVSTIILGAASHGILLQNFVTTIPIKVAMHAPCTTILVRP